MKKRLRKKLFLGEFQELGFDLKAKVNLQEEAAMDAFWNKFVQKVEELDVHCNGAFGSEEFDIFVLVGKVGPQTEERKIKLIEWFKTQPEVAEVEGGELVDAFYSTCGCHDEDCDCHSH